MGGGTSIWASPEWKKDSREIFNSKLLHLGITIAFAGCSYGFNQGNIGGVMMFSSFRKAIGFDTISEAEANTRERNMAAMLAAGGTAGPLLVAPLSDFLGKKKAVTVMAGLFLVGCSMQEVPNLEVLYAGRLLAGVAIGATSMLAPQYLAENSPKSDRGSLTTSYNLMIIPALAVAFWVIYAVRLWPEKDLNNNNKSWQLALSLISKGKTEQGLRNLCKLRGLPADHTCDRQEYMESLAQAEAEQKTEKGIPTPCFFVQVIISNNIDYGYIVVVKHTSTNASNRRRLFLPLCSFFIVDRVGRWLPLMIGATIQATLMLYIGRFPRFSKVEPGPHFAIINYGITSATLHMLSKMKHGTFLFFVLMTYIGVILVFFCLPELKGRSIESMDDLFANSLWTVFQSAYPTEDEKIRHDVREQLHQEDDKTAPQCQRQGLN
ncbi:hypothetical protein LY76DRAFT_620560 [Colletotrichum caudatum]|nr:hypothetical protein LY76DRAFT_620560 [Colletotrichum caudatum]